MRQRLAGMSSHSGVKKGTTGYARGAPPVKQSMATQTLRKVLTREFVLSAFGLFTVGFVFHILAPTLPIYLSTLGSTEIEIGVLVGTFMLASLLFRPVVGKILLKIPEKRLMIAGALLFVITSFAYLLAMPFWPLMIVRLVQGVGFACFHTAAFTLIANTSAEEHRGQSLSYFILSFNFASALAPSIGVFLINHFNFTVLFLTCMGLSLCCLIVSLQLRARRIVPQQESARKDRSLFSRGAVLPSTIGAFTLFGYGGLSAFFPLYAIRHGVSNPGIFFTVIASMLILCRALGGRVLNYSSRDRIILPCLMTYILSMVILSFSKTLPMFILVAVIWGVGHAFLIPTLMVYALEEGGVSGPAMATFHAITDVGLCLGPVVMGIVLRLTSYPVMFMCIALMGAGNLSFFYFIVRKKK
jgi:predicted MFS family arabinose efflux permease